MICKIIFQITKISKLSAIIRVNKLKRDRSIATKEKIHSAPELSA